VVAVGVGEVPVAVVVAVDVVAVFFEVVVAGAEGLAVSGDGVAAGFPVE
jgi:hypothetical protein